ncbi:MAG TPA: alpha/beta hydrolase, partial [Chloroflexota bacterium]|nr:alpha/beta hydrolase [Chloroflexota bacterium]
MAVTLDLTEEATSHFIQAGDIRMHYNEAGSGEAVICIHGGGPGASGWSNYNRNIAALSQRFRVLLVDMPGFGKSDAVVIKGESRPEYNAKAFKNFLDALG